MSRKKDTDYLAISTRIHAMENRMLNQERMDRMIEAREDSEVQKILAECGYTSSEGLSAQAVGTMLAKAQAEVFHEIRSAVPDPRVTDVFQIKYDYHNAKVLMKGAAKGRSADRLLLPGGRYAPEGLAEAFQKDAWSGVSLRFQEAVREAREVLSTTHDPQWSDAVLDRACFEEMAQLAKGCQSTFLEGFVRLSVDAANLRTAVRVARIGKDNRFLLQVLLPGGNVPVSALVAVRGEDLGSLFQTSPLKRAAELGGKIARPAGGPLTIFERECDNAVTQYVADARRIPFGEQTVVAYLYGKEAELTAIRTILAGRRAGLEGEIIRERLRETYV